MMRRDMKDTYFKKNQVGIPWQSSGQDSMLALQGAQGLIPGGGTKIPQALRCGQKTNKQTKNIKRMGDLDCNIDASTGWLYDPRE